MKLMTILITDAGSSFGRAAAEALTEDGHHVVAAMKDPSGGDREWANALWAQSIEVVPMDMSLTGSMERDVSGMIAKAGAVDVWIDASGFRPLPVEAGARGPSLGLAGIPVAGRAIIGALARSQGIVVSLAATEGGDPSRTAAEDTQSDNASPSLPGPDEPGVRWIDLRAASRELDASTGASRSGGEASRAAASCPDDPRTDDPRDLVSALRRILRSDPD